MHDNGDTEDQLPSAPLLRSFLLVAGSYMLNVLLLGAVAIVLIMTMFPESYEILNLEPEQFNAIFEENPERVFPPLLLWLLLAASCVICFGLGYFVASKAPLARFPHAIFFAAILFVQYLQLAMGATDTMQRMLVLFMGASPIAAILGANLFLRGIDQTDVSGQETFEQD